MRNIISLIALCCALLFACKKEEMPTTTPRYSIVRFNDEYAPLSCDYDKSVCLPVADLDDLRFQLITGFPTVVTEAVANYIVAVPGQVCGEHDEDEVARMLFGEDPLPFARFGGNPFVNDESGFVKFIADGKYSEAPAVGDYIFVFQDQSGRYNGWHRIVSIVPDGSSEILTTATAYTGQPAGTPTIGLVNKPFIYTSGQATQIANNTEFAGANYVHDLNLSYDANLEQDDGECFRLIIYRIQVDLDVPTTPDLLNGECLGTTNCFTKVSDLCHTTKIKYQFNEDAMGFYGEPSTNIVRLPMYLSRPQYPGEETGYQTSEGKWLKLAERVNKEWQLETAWLPDALHQNIRMALSADFIQLWNQNENLALEGVYRSEDYNIEWDENVDYPLAKATTTIKKRVLSASVNSNCV